MTLPRINEMLGLAEFQQHMSMIEEIETDRVFCRHGFDHALAVARISYAYLLEQGEGLAKEVVYAAAFLHDVGRWVEYQTGEDHAEASARLAVPLLRKCRYEEPEIALIIQAIREHRRHQGEDQSALGRALALADNWARDCRNCQVRSSCHKYTSEMLEIMF